jgi:hypothetical protein
MTNVDEVVERIIALRDLTADTGTITKRSQGRILQTLTDDEMAAVAWKLRCHSRVRGILSGAPVVQDAK